MAAAFAPPPTMAILFGFKNLPPQIGPLRKRTRAELIFLGLSLGSFAFQISHPLNILLQPRAVEAPLLDLKDRWFWIMLTTLIMDHATSP